ncbi:hypothetical protein GINT2_002335 [Glugoides intestinalis]
MLYFKNHDLPNVAISAIAGHTIFYFDNNHLYSHSIQTGICTEVFKLETVSFLSVLEESFLCLLTGNILLVTSINSNLLKIEIKLKTIPEKVFKYKDALGFIYPESIEIFKIGKKRSVLIETPFVIRDIATDDEHSYVLTSRNQVLKFKNIFITEQFTPPTRMSCIMDTVEQFNRIFIYKESLFLLSNDSVHKYHINRTSLSLQYTLALDSRDAVIYKDYLMSETLVHLSKAPFLLIKDKVYSFDGHIAITAGRLYFLEEEDSIQENTYPIYSSGDTTRSINPNSFKIPEIIKDQGQREQYQQSCILLEEYKRMVERAEEIIKGLNSKEKKQEEELCELKEKLEVLEKKNEELNKRVESLKARARKVACSGDSRRFYSRVSLLKELLEKVPTGKLNSLKEKLKVQNVVLKDKAISK